MATLMMSSMVFAILASFWITSASAIDGIFTTLTPQQQQSPPQQLEEHSLFSHTALLPSVLSHLGFHELARAAPSLADTSGNAWIGPSTLFAPSDASLRTCYSCSISNLLREHIVPGFFSIDYLRKLSFGTKIETLSPGRCITITSEGFSNSTGPSKLFIGGVEITHPDLFNNGFVVIHGIQGYISPLSPFSCEVERLTSLSFPLHPDRIHQLHPSVHPAVMRLMLRDAMLRLRNNGFIILALAMKVKYEELVRLNNMTVFTVDDVAIFTGSHSYIRNVKFHIVPNHFLTMLDLEKLPVGTTLPTLERGQSLVITGNGGEKKLTPVRINYVSIKIPDVMRNLKIVVHSLFFPFPHIHPDTSVYERVFSEEASSVDHVVGHKTVEGTCEANAEVNGVCGLVPTPQIKPTVEIEDHHGA